MTAARVDGKAGPESRTPLRDASDGGRRTSVAREGMMTTTATRGMKAGIESQTPPALAPVIGAWRT